ncbi:MAG TPA: PDZ domain-containing protein [Actinocrinis sp.]|nr:PDZ domain-containing protein [Actinocrinis sp.]
MAASSYLRYPHLAQDLLVFAAEDDVWLVPVGGGRASRLTADQVQVSRPRLSPDARHVAWSSARAGAPEVFSLLVDGGTVDRLTYWGGNHAYPGGWLSDDEVLVLSANAHHTTQRRTWAYGVRLDGRTRSLPYGPAAAVDLAPDGAVLVNSCYMSEPAYWKHYLGGAGGKVWLDRDGAGQFGHILGEVGNHLVNPMFVGDRIAFLSDHEGTGALYSTTREGADLRRHGDHEPFYARHAATDGTRVVYECAGEIWLLASLDAEPERIPITLGGARPGREPFPVRTGSELSGYHLDQTGRVATAEVRGTVHWLPAEHGPARTLLAEPGVRAKLPRHVPGKSAVLCVSDAGGEDGLDLLPAAGGPARRIGHGLLGRVHDLVVAPDGTKAAVASENGGLFVVDLAEDAAPEAVVTELARSEVRRPHDISFSPDSALLAWAQPWMAGLGTLPASHIRLARLADGVVVDVTARRFDSSSAAFTFDGKYLVLLSNQSYDPVYDAHQFSLGFLPGVRPYLVTLAADTPSPFAPELDGRPVGPQEKDEKDDEDEDEEDSPEKDEEAKGEGQGADAGAGEGEDKAEGKDKAKDKPAADAPKPVRVDLDGIEQRIVPFPVEAGEYWSLHAVKGGVAWMGRTVRGELGENWSGTDDDPPDAVLYRYDLAKRKRTVLVGELSSYDVSGDGGRIAYYDGALKIKGSDEAGEDQAISVDLDRIRVRVDPVAEWTQMYDEAWRLQRDNFWRRDMGGVDWPAMAERYRPVLQRIGTSGDLADVLWELQAELGSSHAYVSSHGAHAHSGDRQGLLGADLAPDPDGVWRITRILPGETSAAGGRSPLTAPGVAAAAGDAVTAVDGRPVDPARGPNPLLAGKAGKPVELTLRRDGSEGAAAKSRRVVVVPVASEYVLRYHDLIATRRAMVHELSGGRIGYLHAPDMATPGWADFHRDLTVEISRDGLLFDLRENGGGHTSQLVIGKLARKIIGWDVGDRVGNLSYPLDAPRGPVVTLIDEMAASDGDIAAHAIRVYRIGPLVGTRTWGGVIGIEGFRKLVDGTRVSQPKLAFWAEGAEWGLENYGVDPDIEVPFPPQDWAAGHDPQLAAGVRIALEALESTPALRPPGIPPLPVPPVTYCRPAWSPARYSSP